MVDGTAGGKSLPANMPISATFSHEGLISQERRAAIISSVLNEFSDLPVDVKNALRAVVNEEIVPTSGGFRRGQAGRALERSSFLLQEPLQQAVLSSEGLAGSVLQCWAEANAQLRCAVASHLSGRGLTCPGPDMKEMKFRGYWPAHQWQLERDAFLQANEDFVPDDVALMLCYVSGNFPLTADAPTGEGAGRSLNDDLSAALAGLRELPAAAQEWERQIPDFIASVSRLIEEKADQLRWSEEFDVKLGEVNETYEDLLRFFECDTIQWSAARVSAEVDGGSVIKLIDVLRAQLSEYLPTHGTASSISEERERIERRAALQPPILQTLQQLQGLMTGESLAITVVHEPQHPAVALPSKDSPYAATDPAQPTGPSGDWVAVAKGTPRPPDAPAGQPPHHLEPPLAGSLQEAHHTDESASRGAAVALADAAVLGSPEMDALMSENVELREGTVVLRSENQDLRNEVETLKTELFSSQEREDSWRLAYRSAMDSSQEEVGIAPPVVESVQDAVEMARSQFRQELLFAPNSESNIEDNPFNDPGRVWEALKWLATTYFASKMGRVRITDFDQSVKEACGWWYKSDQGETTVSKFEKSYTTRVDGKRYTLVEHIGKGTTFDARYTIRVAFDWDRERRQVIIGYVGRHQQTDAS